MEAESCPWSQPFFFRTIPLIVVGCWTQESHRHHQQLPLLQVPCVPSLDSRECKHLSKEFVNCYYSENTICYLECHLELLVPSFASVLQAALAWTDPGWIQFRSVKTHSPVAQQTAETPHASGACFAGELTALVPGYSLAASLLSVQSGFSCSSSDCLSHWMPWKLLNAQKVNEKILLVGWPEQLSRLSRSDS